MANDYEKQKKELIEYFEKLDDHHKYMLVAVAKLMVDATTSRKEIKLN